MFLIRLLPIAVVTATMHFAAEPRQYEPVRKACCFTNPGYAGTCKVVPAEDETCASILAYLNDPMAEGKSYCGGATVRRGRTEVSCEDANEKR
ncbi:MAG: hypothetical protein ACRD3V_21250 [Vicinamibacteria bacterium]